VPDQDAYLLGAAVEGEPVAGTAVVGRYQREIWFDRSALVSERASLDVTSSTLPPLRVDASADWDFAFARFGKAHVTEENDVILSELVGGREGFQIATAGPWAAAPPGFRR